MGFKPMTSEILVQGSTNWANWELVIKLRPNKPSKWWIMIVDNENHICALWWRNKYEILTAINTNELSSWNKTWKRFDLFDSLGVRLIKLILNQTIVSNNLELHEFMTLILVFHLVRHLRTAFVKTDQW